MAAIPVDLGWPLMTSDCPLIAPLIRRAARGALRHVLGVDRAAQGPVRGLPLKTCLACTCSPRRPLPSILVRKSGTRTLRRCSARQAPFSSLTTRMTGVVG